MSTINKEMVSPVFSPDGKQIAGGIHGPTGKLCLVDAETGEEVRVFQGHQELVTSVAWSPDGKQLVSGSHDDSVRVWESP